MVIGVLGGDYKTVAMEMSLDDMKKDDGLDLLIAHLDKVFEKDKNDNAYEKYIIFEDIRRNPGEDIGEFMIRFDRAMKQAKAIEIVYPDNVLAFKLMRSMNLSADEQKMIMTACTEIKYATMQSAIKRILSGKSLSSSACGSNEIRIKQEAQDSFYARGAYNQSNRGGSKSGYSKYQQYGSNVNQQQYQPQAQGKNKPPLIPKTGLAIQCCVYCVIQSIILYASVLRRLLRPTSHVLLRESWKQSLILRMLHTMLSFSILPRSLPHLKLFILLSHLVMLY